jgi:hypothetical protein
MLSTTRLGCLLCWLVALSACQTTRPPSPGAPTAPLPATPEAEPPAQRPAIPPEAPLAAEARWLGELFAGTPVQVNGERDGAVRLGVPLKYAFESAAVTPKAPLQAVLDKLSQSLKRQPTARLQVGPPSGTAAAERLAAIRAHLAGKGVPNWRVAATSPAADDQVLLRLVPPPTGIRRLDDSSLAPPAAGIRVLPPPPAASVATGR